MQRWALAQAGPPRVLRRECQQFEGLPLLSSASPKPFIFQTCFSGSLFYGSKPFTFVLSTVCLPPTIPRDPGQVREGEKAGEPLQEWILWIRANSRDETQGPWLMSITEGITQMTISGTQK